MRLLHLLRTLRRLFKPLVANDQPKHPIARARSEERTKPPQAETRVASEVRLLVSTLVNAGFRADILDPQPYEDAVSRLVVLGEDAVPELVTHLGYSRYIAIALGTIATADAVDALAVELRSSDWRRIEAAARGLGISKAQRATSHLEAGLRTPAGQTVVEVRGALEWALNEIYTALTTATTPRVDHEHIWSQMESLKNVPADRREAAIALWKALIEAIDDIEVRTPSGLTGTEAKVRAWLGLGISIYYLRNPQEHTVGRPCSEAEHCFRRALELQPNDSQIRDNLHAVSERGYVCGVEGCTRRHELDSDAKYHRIQAGVALTDEVRDACSRLSEEYLERLLKSGDSLPPMAGDLIRAELYRRKVMRWLGGNNGYVCGVEGCSDGHSLEVDARLHRVRSGVATDAEVSLHCWSIRVSRLEAFLQEHETALRPEVARIMRAELSRIGRP